MRDNILYTIRNKITGEYSYSQNKLNKAKTWLTYKNCKSTCDAFNRSGSYIYEVVTIELKIK